MLTQHTIDQASINEVFNAIGTAWIALDKAAGHYQATGLIKQAEHARAEAEHLKQLLDKLRPFTRYRYR